MGNGEKRPPGVERERHTETKTQRDKQRQTETKRSYIRPGVLAHLYRGYRERL